ncbi:MAG: hypothetical protein J7L88_00935, partial [Thermoplasmata archaeon]|nr:hypothetical protein [Thermoplasmata archaeon]
IIVALDSPLEGGERVTIKVQTEEGITVKEKSFKVSGGEGLPTGYIAITVISLLIFALLILYIARLRKEALLEE